ncbi:MAG: DMT family transporter [Nocardioidaceae bacterium]|nr:DMT family transporter [Nocardioidaceae bacterium]
MSKDLLERSGVLDYLGVRFLLAAAVLALVRPGLLVRLDRHTVRAGAGLGVVYTVAQALQFLGLKQTAPTVSAFVVAMYVVFTPLLAAVVLRRRPDRTSVLATALATVGVAAMSLRGWAIGPGELLTLVAAVLYAVHILAVGAWARAGAAFELAFVQLLTMGVLFTVVAAPGGIDVPQGRDWPAFVYLSVGAAAVALLVQTWAQAHLDPARAAVLMVLEPVWAALFAFALWHEALGLRTLAGATLVLAAMVIVITRPGTLTGSGASMAENRVSCGSPGA